MAKSSTKISVPDGNEFRFYVPKQTPSNISKLAALKAATAAPSATSSGPATTVGAGSTGTSGTAALTASERIKSNFEELTKANPLYNVLKGSHHVVSPLDLVRAALECGYGRTSNWTAALALSTTEALGLSTYLLSRLQMVTDCLEIGKSCDLSVRTFHHRVEASEKTAISFILGGIGTYLAAEKWLGAIGDPVDLFLHVGLYTKAISVPTPLFSTSAAATKSLPDYVAVSKSRKLHLFESKGGNYTGRLARIVEGLKQLSVAPLMGWGSAGPSSVESLNCVHTSVDSGKPLRITLIDPPPQRFINEPSPLEPDDGVFLIASVPKLLLVLESVAYFDALVNLSPEVQLDVGPEGYSVASSPFFGGMLVGVPKVFLDRADAIRKNVAVFLAIREVLDDLAFHGMSADKRKKLFKKRVLNKLRDVDLGQKASGNDSDAVHTTIEMALTHLRERDLLNKVAISLELEALSEQVQLPPIAKLNRASQVDGGAFTNGGLWLKERLNQGRGRG